VKRRNFIDAGCTIDRPEINDQYFAFKIIECQMFIFYSGKRIIGKSTANNHFLSLLEVDQQRIKGNGCSVKILGFVGYGRIKTALLAVRRTTEYYKKKDENAFFHFKALPK
jgi:hypothetical protein